MGRHWRCPVADPQAIASVPCWGVRMHGLMLLNLRSFEACCFPTRFSCVRRSTGVKRQRRGMSGRTSSAATSTPFPPRCRLPASCVLLGNLPAVSVGVQEPEKDPVRQSAATATDIHWEGRLVMQSRGRLAMRTWAASTMCWQTSGSSSKTRCRYITKQDGQLHTQYVHHVGTCATRQLADIRELIKNPVQVGC